MRPTSDDLELMAESLARAEHLCDRLLEILPRMQQLTPLTRDRLYALSAEERVWCDAYLKRFEDAFESAKAVFRSALFLARGEFPRVAYDALVLAAEHRGVILSAASWFEVRKARNSAAHEYAMDPDEQAALLNEAVEQARNLLAQLGLAIGYTQAALDAEQAP